MSRSSLEETDVSNLDLIHPEILSTSQLYYVLKKKQLDIEIDRSAEKDELLEIYYKAILPLPQREYRENRRGLLLLQKRKKCLEKRKIEAPTASADKNTEIPSKSPRLSSESLRSTDVSNRLKAPPSPITCEKKIVRLNMKACNGSDISPTAKNSSSSPPVSNNKGKIIKLINDTLMSSTRQGPDLSVKRISEKHKKVEKEIPPSPDESLPAKKKHKPITWP